jgi:hypothetical protein
MPQKADTYPALNVNLTEIYELPVSAKHGWAAE